MRWTEKEETREGDQQGGDQLLQDRRGGDQLLQDRRRTQEQAQKDRAKLFEVILKFEPRLEGWPGIGWPEDFKKEKGRKE